jgi:predicted nucleic acid-binding protein
MCYNNKKITEGKYSMESPKTDEYKKTLEWIAGRYELPAEFNDAVTEKVMKRYVT